MERRVAGRFLPAGFFAALVVLGACREGRESGDSGAAGPPAWVLGEVVDTEGPGVLARLPAPWGSDLLLLRVQGSPYDMGYQHGRLVGPMLLDLWWTYMGVIAGEAGLSDPNDADLLLGSALDTAWGWYEPNVPAMFLEEFDGFGAGLVDAGVDYGDGPDDVAKLPRRIVTLVDIAMSSHLDKANIASMGSFLANGYSDELLAFYGESRAPDPASPAPVQAAATADPASPLLNCSFFAAWGDRSDDGGLYMTRNMDFEADSGLYRYAMVAVYVPDDGVPVASISWLGASLGVLAGVSEEGIAMGAVGSSSPYERLATEPAVLRAREVLQTATTLEEASPFLTNSVDDGLVRAPTIGYNGLVAWGDPRGGGAQAGAVIIENNGLEAGLHRHDADCSVTQSYLRYARDGSVELSWTHDDHPDEVNTEADAQEIDAQGNVRLFSKDGKGNTIEDPKHGSPIQTGYPEDCALYRGDEALAYGVRVHQTAANGPADGGTGLMVDSGSWRERYWPMREMTRAYADGSSFSWEGTEVVADNGGTPVPVGLDQTEQISRVAAMDSNVWDVAFDTTDLVIRVSFESGTGKNWVRAADQPEYLEIDLRDLFLTD
jgi:hypothetical protein